MKKIIFILLPCMLLLTSCYRYNVRMNGGAATTITEQKTGHVTLWGAKKEIYNSDVCPSGTMYEIEVRATFLQSLVNILTLGFYHPITMKYTCAQKEE